MYRGAPACSFPEECMYKMMRTEMEEEERSITADEIAEIEARENEMASQQYEANLFDR